MVDKTIIANFDLGHGRPIPPTHEVDFTFGSTTVPGALFEISLSAGEGFWQGVIALPDTMVAEVRLEFKKLWSEPDSDDILLVFGEPEGLGVVLVVDPMGAGESMEVGLFTPMVLGEIKAATGESIVSAQRALKDPRLYAAVLAAPQPFNNGWAFLSSAQASWQPGYTQTGSWHHFYGQSEGVTFDFPRSQLLIVPASSLVEIFGAGNGFYPVYSTTNGSAVAAAGETLVAGLRLEFMTMGKVYSTGEWLTFRLATIRNLDAPLRAGESLRIDLEVLSMRTDVGVGENVLLSLDVYDLVNPRSYTGETITTSLTTTAAFSIAVNTGEVAAAIPEWPAASFLSSNLSAGGAFTLFLNTNQDHRFSTDLGDGQSLVASLTLPVRSDMQITAWAGAVALLPFFSTAASLGAVMFFDGSTLAVEDLNEVSNYKAADGVTLTASFSASPSFTSTAFDGATLRTTLEVRPPAQLASTFHTGEEFLFPTMSLMIAAPLRVTFCDGVFIEASESTSTTYYDLEGPPSRPNQLKWWLDMNQFEFIDMPPSFSWGSGPGIVVTVDLQTRPRFQISVSTGESFVMDRGYDYLEVTAHQGIGTRPLSYFYIEPTINLCYPNVFPNTDSMEVELDFDEETCYADYLHDGQSLKSSLSCIHTVAPVWWNEGSLLTFNLTIYDFWRVQIWDGQWLDLYLGIVPAFPTQVSVGESLGITLEEPTVEIGVGESLEMDLTITFEVEFLEQGCLDNEYRYMTPNGDEDLEKFTPVAVEFEPYSHEIKARCF